MPKRQDMVPLQVPPTLVSSNQIFEEIRAFSDLFRSVQALKFGTETAVRSSSVQVAPVDVFEPVDRGA